MASNTLRKPHFKRWRGILCLNTDSIAERLSYESIIVYLPTIIFGDESTKSPLEPAGQGCFSKACRQEGNTRASVLTGMCSRQLRPAKFEMKAR